MIFETLVRPFAAPVSLGTQRIAVSILKVADQDANISWGVAGDIIQPQEVILNTGAGSGSAFESFQVQNCNTKSTEQHRTTVKQRITNPDDETQFIDFAVPQQITFTLKPQNNTLNSKFDTESTTWANTDEVFSEVSDVLDPPDQTDSCKQSLAFSTGSLSP